MSNDDLPPTPLSDLDADSLNALLSDDEPVNGGSNGNGARQKRAA